jgi:hypothetical protein
MPRSALQTVADQLADEWADHPTEDKMNDVGLKICLVSIRTGSVPVRA